MAISCFVRDYNIGQTVVPVADYIMVLWYMVHRYLNTVIVKFYEVDKYDAMYEHKRKE